MLDSKSQGPHQPFKAGDRNCENPGGGPRSSSHLPLTRHTDSLVSEAQVSYSRDAVAFCAIEWGELQSDAGKTLRQHAGGLLAATGPGQF